MGWVTLTLRRQVLTKSSNDIELRDIELSRQLRNTQNQYAYDETLCQNDKNIELNKAKDEYSLSLPSSDIVVIRDSLIKFRPDLTNSIISETKLLILLLPLGFWIEL